jgi:hypothetical protein
MIGKGRLTLKAYSVVGAKDIEDCIEDLQALAFDGFIGGGEKATGWVSTDHALDIEFSPEKNKTGQFLVFGLRIDQRKVNPAIYKAHCAMELKAVQEALGGMRVPLDERRDIRRRVKQQLLADVAPKTAVYDVFWDIAARRLYFGCTSPTPRGEFTELFERSFGLKLESRNAAKLSTDYALKWDLFDQLKEVTPAQFAKTEEDGAATSDYQFLMQEFVQWLWFHTEVNGGDFNVGSQQISAFVEDNLVFGEDGIICAIKGGLPTRRPETAAALATGQLLQKAKMHIAVADQDYEFTIDARTLDLSSVKLPAVEADDPIEQLTERLMSVKQLRHIIESLYETFLSARLGSVWPAELARMQAWVEEKGAAHV